MSLLKIYHTSEHLSVQIEHVIYKWMNHSMQRTRCQTWLIVAEMKLSRSPNIMHNNDQWSITKTPKKQQWAVGTTVFCGTWNFEQTAEFPLSTELWSFCEMLQNSDFICRLQQLLHIWSGLGGHRKLLFMYVENLLQWAAEFGKLACEIWKKIAAENCGP